MTVQDHDQFRDRLLRAARALPARRVSKLRVDGRDFYVKMAETHANWRWRLQKGDPQAAFARERSLLDAFGARGAAVSEVVTQDDVRIVLADHGTPLHRLLVNRDAARDAFHAAGLALAALHGKGLAHGRPSLRDLCWDGSRVTFLDLEAGAKLDATARDKARDLLLLLHSALMFDPDAPAAAQTILRAYRGQNDAEVWAAVQRLARWLRWLEIPAAPLMWWHDLRKKKRSEYRALRQLRPLVCKSDGLK